MDTSLRRWRILRPLVLALAASCLVAGAVLVWWPAPVGSPVLVAARPLGPGDRIGTRDLRVVHVPPDARPEDALDTGAARPTTWSGGALARGTILTASNSGAVGAAGLAPGERQVSVPVAASQALVVRAGDVVDVWSTPSMCDQSTCTASLLASAVRIISSVVAGDPSWDPSRTSDAQVTLVLRVEDIDRVLGHAGTNSLTMVLRPGGAATDLSGEIP